MAKSKSKKNSTQLESVPNNLSGFDHYYNTLAHQMAPSNAEHKKRVAIALTEWAKGLTEPLDMEDFIDTQGITPPTFYEWMKKCPELKEANEFAKRRLANIRLKKCQTGDWNWTACRHVMGWYGERYWDLEKQHAAIKAQAQNQTQLTPKQAIVPGILEKDGKVVLVWPDSN